MTQSTETHRKEREAPPCLVVIGGSAGSIEALQTVMAGLPADLAASVLVVVHIAPGSPRVLDRILDRAGPLPVTTAIDGEPMEPGHVYVAPPDRHLILQDGHVRTVYGPRQNRSRPAIDPLFSSAARFDGKVIAVVLSGMLDDGTMGALLVKEAGGTVIVQSPADAAFPSMPSSAIAYAGANYVLPAADIGGIIAALVSRSHADGELTMFTAGHSEAEEEEIVGAGAGRENRRGETVNVVENPLGAFDEPFTLACPECGGAMITELTSNPLRYRCFLGHAYTSMSLWSSQLEEVEANLWSTLRVLEETAFLGHKIVDKARVGTLEESPARVAGLEAQVASIEARIQTIRGLLGELHDSRNQTAGQGGGGTLMGAS